MLLLRESHLPTALAAARRLRCRPLLIGIPNAGTSLAFLLQVASWKKNGFRAQLLERTECPSLPPPPVPSTGKPLTWPSCRGPGGKFAACGGSCAPELRRHGANARHGIGAYATMQAEELHAVASLCPAWSCSCRLSLPIPGHQPCAQREESSTRNAANILPVAQDAAGHSCRSRSGNPALFVPRARRDMLAAI